MALPARSEFRRPSSKHVGWPLFRLAIRGGCRAHHTWSGRNVRRLTVQQMPSVPDAFDLEGMV
jgi:hypothetical protein